MKIRVGLVLFAVLMLAGCGQKQAKQDNTSSSKTTSSTVAPKKVAVAVNHGQTRIPLRKWHKTTGAARIPILMYHDINVGNTLQMPRNQMQNQMHWLKDAGYYFLSPDEAYVALTQNKLPQKNLRL